VNRKGSYYLDQKRQEKINYILKEKERRGIQFLTGRDSLG
jgi:hypothetical protein